jgi:hypothetical protein
VRGKAIETVEYPAYCAVALAGLGDLPDTILTRSVVVRMRRRARSETVEPFRRRMAITQGHPLRDRLATWAARTMNRLGDAWPEMPTGVEDRDADVWEALLAVADAAGGDWPIRARAAAVALVAQSKETTPSLGVRLLADLRTVFGDREALSCEDALSALCELPEAPWGEVVAGKPLNAHGLAKRLTGYGVKSKNIRIGEKVFRGYARADLADAWERYLPPLEATDGADWSTATDDTPSPSPRKSATSATSATRTLEGAMNGREYPHNNASFGRENGRVPQAPLIATAASQSATSAAASVLPDPDVAVVADVADFRGDRERPANSVMGHAAVPASGSTTGSEDPWAYATRQRL